MKNFKTLIVFVAFFVSNSLFSQIISNEVFIKGNYVEVGVNDYGAYGTNGYAPLDYHPRLEIGNSNRNLGFVADADKDGWAIGTPNYYGDFFYPGQRQEGFSIQFNGNRYHNWTSGVLDIPGNNISLTTEGTNDVTLWQGTINGLLVKQKTIVPLNDVYFVVRVELQNTTAVPMTGVYYVRTLDPDNEVSLSGDYTTLNEIVYKLPNTNNNTLVSAKGLSYTDCYLGLGTRDCRAKPFIITSSLYPNTTDPLDAIYNETLTSSFLFNGSLTSDVGVGISFEIGDIAPGETKRFAMAYILKQTDLEIALSQTLPEVRINTTQTLVNSTTYNFCEGENVNFSVLNGEENVWHWQPEEFFSTPFGENVVMSVPDATTTFTVTGESDCSPVTYTFTVTPATYQSPLTPINHALCSGSSTSYNPLAGVTTPTSTINWYDAPTGGTLLSTNPLFTTPVLNNTSATPAVYTYYYQETNVSSCVSERIPFEVTVYSSLNLPNEELTLCLTGTTIGNFDLTDVETVNNATYTYYASMADLTSGTPITNTTNFNNVALTQTVYANVVIATGCSDVIEITLKVFSQLNVNTAVLNGCDDDFDDTLAFNLTSANSTLYSGTDSSFAYFLTQANAEDNINEITNFTNYSNITNPQTIYVRVYNTNCYQVTSMVLNVYDKPILSTGTLTSCQTNTDGSANFNLTSANSQFNSSDTSLVYAFYTSMLNLTNNIQITNPTSFANTSNPQTIYVKSTNGDGCFSTTELQLNVNPVTNLSISNLFECDDNADGFVSFDLTSNNSVALASLPPDTYTYTYYNSASDAFSAINPITSNFTNTSSPQTVYVRAQGTTGCPYIIDFDLVVLVKPVVNINPTTILCQGTVITLNAGSGYDSYLWSNGATTSSIVVNTPGTYTVTVSNDYGVLSCTTTASINVIESNAATITEIDVDDWTNEENVISVSVQGLGNYEYSLDNINFQSSPIFSGLESGIYTVYVRDVNNCGMVNQQVYVLTYPNFFTPNGDGVHDYWNIRYSTYEPDLRVVIYDRYGKVIKGLRGSDSGWDGTYNGKMLPSTDYWFVVTRADGTIHKGHFSMVR